MFFGKIRKYFKELKHKRQVVKNLDKSLSLEKASFNAFDKGSYTKSYQYIKTVYQLFPSSNAIQQVYIGTVSEIGDAYRKDNKINQALKYYLKLVPLNTKNWSKSRLFFYIGYCYFELNKFHYAYDFFKKSLMINSKNSACMDLVISAIRLGKEDSSIIPKTAKFCIQKAPNVFYPYVSLKAFWNQDVKEIYMRTINNQGNTAIGHGVKGLLIMSENGDLYKAQKEFEVAKSMNPAELYYQYLYVYILFHYAAKDKDTNHNIINSCNACLQICTNQGMSLANNDLADDVIGMMVDTFIINNDEQNATGVIEKALKINSLSNRNKGYLYAGLANINKHFHQPTQAVIDYEKALKEYPTAKTYKTLGNLSFKLNFYDITSNAYKGANHLDKHILNSNDFQKLGRTEFNLKNYSKALKEFKSANKLNYKNAEIYGDMGECLTKLHQYSKAMNYYQLALKYDSANQFYAHQINSLKAKASN